MLRKSSWLFILAIAIVAVAFPVRSQVLSEDPADATKGEIGVQTIKFSLAEQEAARAFFTPDVIAAAEPMPMPIQTEGEVPETFDPLEVLGEAGFVVAGMAAPNADAIAREAFPEAWEAIDSAEFTPIQPATDQEGTSQIYSYYTINSASALQTMYPHRWVGRITMNFSGSTSYCSGTAMPNNVVLTAAHCLYDTTNNRWLSSASFSPAYRNGSAPYGSFAATQCWILTAWVNLSGSFSINTWSRYDIGVCTVGTNSAGQSLNSLVGWMGYGWNASYTKHFHNMGYPFRNYNNQTLSNAGRYLRTCVAESRFYTTDTFGMGCGYGGGISGGPWMTDYQVNVVSGYANSVNSGIFIGSRNIYGARFTSGNIIPLCNAAGCY